MTIRYWLSGPRILSGLVRPGISFTANDLRPKRHAQAPARVTGAPIFVLSRSEGGFRRHGRRRGRARWRRSVGLASDHPPVRHWFSSITRSTLTVTSMVSRTACAFPGRGPGANANRRRWRTGAAGCMAARHRARARAIATPFRHGRYAAEAVAERQNIAELMRAMKDLIEKVEDDN